MDFANRFSDRIPEDVSILIRETFNRNLLRNERLSSQLIDAIVALNKRGITPRLLKGTAMLATIPAFRGSRILTDLDIMVSPSEVSAALEALLASDYIVHNQTPADAEKWHVDLGRADDAGMIDLHRTLPGPAFFYRTPVDSSEIWRLIKVGPGEAYVPTPTYQAFILTIHDQFQDSDYWLGNVDLRHLLDLSMLVAAPESIDWDTLEALAPHDLTKNAIETQFLTLTTLLKVKIPPPASARVIPKLQLRRRLLQARFPGLRYVLLPSALLDCRNFRAYRRASAASIRKDPAASISRDLPMFPGWERLRAVLALSRHPRVGKI
ncbi:nucleotidyltransferase family protein [Bradyrhizobium genosp. L]|uniref:nucleotidyltransferase family protein n=1 Tax=Bradyrhizobium genosp. L TaxID=83637 RepID=UPI001FEEF660|nr:nucleotidyltransferase family protein [Bradyrhizobium genosp. L]